MTKLSAASLRGYRLLVILRDGMTTALQEKPAEPGLYRDMLGSSYKGHGPADEKFEVRVVDAGHPVARGVSDYSAVDEHHWPVIHAQDLHVFTRTSGNHVNGYTRTHGAGRAAAHSGVE